MNNAVDALTKLAKDLTDRVDYLERENSLLASYAADMQKQASEAPADKAKSPAQLSSSTVDSTIAGLVKVGALQPEQIVASKKIMMEDPNAVHRVLQKVLETQLQIKTASEEQELYGGRITDTAAVAESPEEACLDRMMRTLGMN